MSMMMRTMIMTQLLSSTGTGKQLMVKWFCLQLLLSTIPLSWVQLPFWYLRFYGIHVCLLLAAVVVAVVVVAVFVTNAGAAVVQSYMTMDKYCWRFFYQLFKNQFELFQFCAQYVVSSAYFCFVLLYFVCLLLNKKIQFKFIFFFGLFSLLFT